MREDPGVDLGMIATCLGAHYDLEVASVECLPLGHDLHAGVHRVVSRGGASYFLKITLGPVNGPALQVQAALVDLGIPNILAPLRTRSADLSCSIDGDHRYGVVLYPFIAGQSAKAVGLSDGQWREFGSTLRAVHDSGLGQRFGAVLGVESFDLPSGAKVRGLLASLGGAGRESRPAARFESPAAARLAAFWLENEGLIRRTLARAEELGARLRATSFERVLCHGDIHAANIHVGIDGRIFLVDWDGPPDPLIAPRERDLLFVVGSRIARVVQPREEDRFFEGYGEVPIDPLALAYFRYERIIQDLGEGGDIVFLDPGVGEEDRAAEAELHMRFLRPGGDVERAEAVTRRGSRPDSS